MAGAARQPSVGIPRTLFYYQYYPLWRRFFGELGARVVVSSPSTKKILDDGVKSAVGDACVPIKLMHGHVLDLVGREVDYIFLPRIVSTNGRTVYCPKFLGLADMITSSIGGLPRLIDVRYDARQGPRELSRAAAGAAEPFTADGRRALAALRAGQADLRRYRQRLLEGMDPEAALAALDNGEDGDRSPAETAHLGDAGRGARGGPSTRGGPAGPASLTLAVVGYPYVVYDPFINLNLHGKLRSLGIRVVTANELDGAEIGRHRCELGKDLFWTYSEEAVCAGFHYMQRPDLADGVIHVTAFGCGPDSVADKLLELRAQELGNVPFMSLMIDEHTGEAGMMTRLEAFSEMVRRRKAAARGTAAPLPEPDGRRPRRRFARRLRKVTFPYLGTLPEVLGDLFRSLGNEVVMPQRPSTRTLTLGTAHSPEFACIPFKILLGTYLEALENGADTIVSTGGVGPCRAGLYTTLHQRILERLSKDAEVITLEPPRLDLREFASRVSALNARGLPIWEIARQVWRVWRKAVALDELERLSHRVRAREAAPGATSTAFREAVAGVHRAGGGAEIKAALRQGREILEAVPLKPGFVPLRVGIVGEIYVVVEPSANFEIEETLGGLGVETERSIYMGGWAGESNLLGRPGTGRNETAEEAARPFLAEMIGGHGQGSVGHAVMYARAGFDGIVQLAPFTCIPEIVAKSVLERVSREYDIPVLSISFDEQTGKAGLMTRLEAFRDLLLRRRTARAKGAGPRPA